METDDELSRLYEVCEELDKSSIKVAKIYNIFSENSLLVKKRQLLFFILISRKNYFKDTAKLEIFLDAAKHGTKQERLCAIQMLFR